MSSDTTALLAQLPSVHDYLHNANCESSKPTKEEIHTMPTIINQKSSRQRHPFAVLLLIILLGAGMLSPAHADWYALRDEPKLIRVDNIDTLSNPDGIRVEIEINGTKELLRGHQARAFLYLRSYIVFDDNAKTWDTTDKYKAWKNNSSTAQNTNINTGTKVKYKYWPGTKIVSHKWTEDASGKKHGVLEVFFKDGRLSSMETWVHGHMSGPREIWVQKKNGKVYYLSETCRIHGGTIVPGSRKTHDPPK